MREGRKGGQGAGGGGDRGEAVGGGPHRAVLPRFALDFHADRQRTHISVGAKVAYFFLAILCAPALDVPGSAAFWEPESVRVRPT